MGKLLAAAIGYICVKIKASLRDRSPWHFLWLKSHILYGNLAGYRQFGSQGSLSSLNIEEGKGSDMKHWHFGSAWAAKNIVSRQKVDRGSCLRLKCQFGHFWLSRPAARGLVSQQLGANSLAHQIIIITIRMYTQICHRHTGVVSKK